MREHSERARLIRPDAAGIFEGLLFIFQGLLFPERAPSRGIAGPQGREAHKRLLALSRHYYSLERRHSGASLRLKAAAVPPGHGLRAAAACCGAAGHHRHCWESEGGKQTALLVHTPLPACFSCPHLFMVLHSIRLPAAEPLGITGSAGRRGAGIGAQ